MYWVLFVPKNISLTQCSNARGTHYHSLWVFSLTVLRGEERPIPDKMFVSFYSGGNLAVVELWLVVPFITSANYRAQLAFSLF